MARYYIQDYWSGLNILDKKGNYTRYFDSYQDADDFLNSLGDLNEEDNFYIVEENSLIELNK